MVSLYALTACVEAPAEANRAPPVMYHAEIVGEGCTLPEPTVLLDEDGLVLEVFSLRMNEVHNSQDLPDDEGLLAYRAAVREAGAAELEPIADPPNPQTEAEAAIWRDEAFNNQLAFSGAVGTLAPITCLDALLFARQNARIPQLERPTEFLAHMLRLDGTESDDLTIVFGAGSDMFPPKTVYGLEVVDEYLSNGWTYWYALHNHTLQKNGELIALGVPVPSTVDVQFARNLAGMRGLENVRVTNGFFTFTAPVNDLAEFRAR
jgi:hypothetical protein